MPTTISRGALADAEDCMVHSGGTPTGQYVGFEADTWSALLGVIRALRRGDRIVVMDDTENTD